MDPTDIPGMITAAATKYGLDPNIFSRQMYQESGFSPKARSSAGAIGVAQLMPGTAKELGVDPNDTAQNIDGGARYLRKQLDEFGSYPLALAAYNAGPDNVRKGIFPNETQNYVRTILGGGALSTGQPRMPDQTPGVLSAGYGLPPGALADKGWMGAGNAVGEGLQGAGAWLESINNPSGGAALLNQANERERQRNNLTMTSMLRPQWTMGQDASGRMIMYNQITGETRAIGPGGTAQPGGGSGGDYYGSGPKAQQAMAEEQNKQLQQEDSDAQAAATKSQGIIDQLLKFRDHINDPNVQQGGIWGPMAAEYKNTAANAPWGLSNYLPGTEGNAATQSFEKDQTTTLSAAKDMIGNMTRFAGPEINVTTRATPSLSNPRETNNEIVNQYIGAQQRVKELGQLAQAYKQHVGSDRLDPGWYKVKQAYMQDPQNSLTNAAKRATSGDAAPQQQQNAPADVRYGPDGRAYVRGPNGEAVPYNQ